MTFAEAMTRIGIAAGMAVSGISHAYLYIHGYQHIPTIGAAFMLQASVSFAVAVLILIGGPEWLQWAAAMVAGGALIAFVLSRTVGLFGFSERGWQPNLKCLCRLHYFQNAFMGWAYMSLAVSGARVPGVVRKVSSRVAIRLYSL
jgi:hypothetical protein